MLHEAAKKCEMITKEQFNLRSIFVGSPAPCHIKAGEVLFRKGEKLTPRKLDIIAAHGVAKCSFQNKLVKQKFAEIAEA